MCVQTDLCSADLSATLGLSEDAAMRRWQMDFNKLEKEQRQSTDLDGQDAGKAACHHWHCLHIKQD